MTFNIKTVFVAIMIDRSYTANNTQPHSPKDLVSGPRVGTSYATCETCTVVAIYGRMEEVKHITKRNAYTNKRAVNTLAGVLVCPLCTAVHC